MPKVRLHVEGEMIEQEVRENANLVVLAGIRQFPKLKYGCGMGKCTKCACKVIEGNEHLDPPNWKEQKMLGEKLEENIRLCCQLTIKHDIVISQDNVLAGKSKASKQVQA
ncbi:2Fe-2S iron-sulfur cluster-binding protein [Bacillus sp. 165]|uniref:2Fe-2S iron-sulfur cluster-binding protein n=1 Tax=Bacillus sp. 165 TaxID=1529117 RepID=UPI001ADA3D05|nr:2Fe-2S iron-sulfur cluster-binding protein [Bacillus sp. 165]MBO9130403.1 (2Fe-2S)-binding protein [Bacillus sp. 165]